MNPSQSTTILRDITGNTNRQSSRVITVQNKMRSKSLCNNNKRYVDYNNQNDNSKSKQTKYNDKVQNIQTTLRQQHRVSLEQFAQPKLNKQTSQSYTQKYQISNLNNYSTNPIYSLWSIPINNDIKQSQLSYISHQIISIAQNQHSYLFLQSNNTFKAVNKNNLQQNTSLSNHINNFLRQQSILLQQIYATPYATFFIDTNQTLYAIGLNDRGQLGIISQKIITYPTQVSLPFPNNKSKSSLRNKSSSSFEKIIKIEGGPFHTVILTTSNKTYYSGILYQENELQNDQYISSFKQINIKNTPLIKDFCCGLTSVIFLTGNNKVYLMGIFGENVFSNPTELQFSFRSQIKTIATVNDCIYINTQKGQLYKADMKRKIPIITEINLNEINRNEIDKNQKSRKISAQNLHISNNQLIIVSKQFSNKEKNTYSYTFFIQKKDTQNYIHQRENQIQQLLLPSLEKISPHKIFILNNHLHCLISSQQSQQLKLQQKSFQEKILVNQNQINSYILKIKQLQQQNYRLRKQNSFLTKSKKQKTPKKQDKLTLSNINYNFEKQVTPRTFTHDLQIQFSQIKLTKKIAEGGYGIIYKGEWKKTQVAVKIFKIDQNNTNSVKEFISQCRAMQALRHPNIVMFLGACMKKPNFSIVLQYCEGGTLWSLLQNHKIDLPWKERVRLALQTAKAMNYLHDRKNPIVHRDLKSLNVLLDANKRVKLADFGWTKSLQNYMTSKIGTYQWMAPQVLTGQKYSEKADVFSYSIILWEIASRQPPYRNINGIQVAYDVANKEYRPTIPSGTPAFFQKLITQCWEKDSQKRPSFKQIIEILDKQFNTIN